MKETEQPCNLVEFINELKKAGVPEEDYSQHIDQYLVAKARANGIPIGCQLELTPLCNLDCKMCYVHLNKSQLNGAKLLTGQQWKKIIYDAKKCGLLKANLTGGECMTHPDFKEIYEYAHELGLQITLNTNGTLLKGDMISFLAKNPPHRMQITLYGSNDDVYEAVTGHRQFTQLMENLKNAKAAGINYNIAITPNRYMKDDLENTVRLAHSLGVMFSINDSLTNPREGTGREATVQDLDYSEYIRLYKLSAELNSDVKIKENTEDIAPFGVAKEGQIHKKGIICGAATNSFHVDWKGKMHPCVEFMHIEEDLLSKPFEDCWKSLNNWANNHLRPLECDNCVYIKNCQHCAAIHDEAGLGNVNRTVCQRVLLRVRAGLSEAKCQQDI